MSKLYNMSYRDVLREFEGYGEYEKIIGKKNKEISLIKLIDWAEQNNISKDKFPRDIKKLYKIQKLDLSKCQLIDLPDTIGNLENLTELNLNGNSLTKLPDTLGNLINLKKLHIRDNKLSELPNDLKKLSKLKELVLSKNPLKEFPHFIKYLKTIEILILDYTEIKFIPNWISKLKLKGLSFSYNKVKSIEPLFTIISLKHLILNGNNLTTLPSSIDKLQNLEVLELRDNALTELPPSIINLENLYSLFIDNNNIKKLPENLEIDYIWAPGNKFSLINIFKYKIKYGVQSFIA